MRSVSVQKPFKKRVPILIILVNGDSIDDGNGADFFMEIAGSIASGRKGTEIRKANHGKSLVGGGIFSAVPDPKDAVLKMT